MNASVRQSAPGNRFGEWVSPISPLAMASTTITVGAPQYAPSGGLFWVESRPDEGGRMVIVARCDDGEHRTWTPVGFNVRSRVHEYGGGEFWLSGASHPVVWFVDFATRRIYRQDSPDHAPVAVTRDESADHRYADGTMTADGAWIIAVRERHEGSASTEVVNEIVAIATDGSGEVHVVVGDEVVRELRADFFSSPTISPDQSQLAWVSWDHPNMPWDTTTISTAPFDAALGVIDGARVRRVGGSSDGSSSASHLHPIWTTAGSLAFLTDQSGWWDLEHWIDTSDEPPVSVSIDRDLCAPMWGLGNRPVGRLSDGRWVAIARHGGNGEVITWQKTGAVTPHMLPQTEFGRTLAVHGQRVSVVAAGPTQPSAIVELEFPVDGEAVRYAVVRASADPIDARDIAVGQEIEFPTAGGGRAYAIYYRPTNHRYLGNTGASSTPSLTASVGLVSTVSADAPDHWMEIAPPLLVKSHGGPTSAVGSGYSPAIQFWTTRGFAVVDVNYRGSTGYGRAYRQALEGAWGIADVDDCIAAADFLGTTGQIDRDRVAIMGGSAGGYTTLASVAFRPGAYAVGMSDYGIGDLGALAADTHKFESRYLDRLVAPYPEGRAIYEARSPLEHVDAIITPMLILQGEDDKVVPPKQAYDMARALESREVTHSLVVYAGEGHGFRKAETIASALRARLRFLGVVLGFDPPDADTELMIKHLSLDTRSVDE